ncbi:MAG: DUF4131 domain-containing protein [Chloroflexi bacterium]|nr:MAG: DUF4131 domain-containing protein [Chloroflexota bacterium]
MLAAWSIGIMAGVLLSPLVVAVSLMTAIAIGIAVLHRRLALLAGLALIAGLMGAGRATLATTVQLPAGLDHQTVAVSGSVDDDPVERRSSRRIVVRLDHCVTETACCSVASSRNRRASTSSTTGHTWRSKGSPASCPRPGWSA